MYYLLALIVIGITLVLPVFLGDFFVAHDLLFHLNWNKFFAEQLWAGDLYPRWLLEMNGGQGSPAFFFYGPVPYYAAAIFKPFLADDPNGWLRLGLSCSLAMVLSGIFSFLWLQEIAERKVAFLGSLLYMLLPYHLQADLFHRFAFAEFWAFVWMPLILYSVSEIVSNVKAARLKLAISYALLIMTHLPTALIFSPLPLLYALVSSERGGKSKVGLNVLAGMFFGLCLSAIYLLPALTTQANVVLSRMTEGRGNYAQGFLISGETLQPIIKDYWKFLSRSTLFVALVAGLFFLPIWLSRNSLNRRVGIFWFVVLLGAVFMMYPWAEPVWRALPILQKIQFPWRFNTILAIAVPALVVVGFCSLKSAVPGCERIATIFISSLVVALAIVAGDLTFERLHRPPEGEKLAMISHSLQFNEDAPEYLPQWVPEETVAIIADRAMTQRVPRFQIVAGEGRVQIRKWQPRHIEVFVQTQKTMLLEIGQFYYPGWSASRENDQAPLPLSPTRQGTLLVEIPAGEHVVRVTLDAGTAETGGALVSLAAWLLFIAGAVYTLSGREPLFA